MEAQGDPGSPDLDFDPEIQAACLQALLGLPIEINQRKIVSSPSEAFAPATKCCWWSHRSVSPPIKFRKFTLYFYSGMHRTGSIIQTLGILIFQNYFSSSSIFGLFSGIIPIILALCANTVNLRPPATGCDNAIFSNLVNMLFLLYHNKLLQYYIYPQ